MPEVRIPIDMPHAGHEKHLCFLHNIGFVQSNLEEYKKLVKEAQYVCQNCGRTAASAESLCKPEKL